MKNNPISSILALAAVAAITCPLAGFARPPEDRQPSRHPPRQERFEPHRRPPQVQRDHRPQPHFRPQPYASFWAPCPPPPPPPPICYGRYFYPPPPPAYYYPCRPGFNVVFTF